MKDQSKKQYITSMVMLGCLFFVFGLVSWVNSILVPYFKVACDLQSEVQGYLAQFAFYIAYLVMTIPASWVLNRTGYKKGAMYGLFLLGIGALLFIPAALLRTYNMFLVALFTMGTALALLQTVANPFATIIGPSDTVVQRMSILGICNKFAGIISPIIFSAIVIAPQKAKMDAINSGAFEGAAREEALGELLRGVIPPYLVLGIFLLIFAVVFYKSSIQDINPAKDNPAPAGDGRKSLLAYPYLVLGVVALFCHLGTQALSIHTIARFAESINFSNIAIFPSMTLACTLFGYLLGVVLVPKYITQKNLLKIVTVVILALSVLVMVLPANIAIWCLVAMGIPNSVVYPGIWGHSLHDLGKWTNLASALLVMALCASGGCPLLYSSIVDSGLTLHQAYWILIPASAYMVFFAFIGYKFNYWTKQKAAK